MNKDGTTVTVTESSEIRLPAEISLASGWSPGSKIRVSAAGEGLFLSLVEEPCKNTESHKFRSVDEVFGILRHDGPSPSDSEIEQAVLDAVKADYESTEWH